MNREIHQIFDKILKLMIIAYANEFLSYVGVEKSIKRILHSEITTKKGRTLFLDFLCELEDGTLLNIEFQFIGPDKYDLDRFHDYNIHSQTEYDSLCETLIISFRTSKSGQKTRKICKTKSIHPMIFHLGDVDFEKILNRIEDKAKNNLKLTNDEEISLLLMCLLPKYKNKKEILERVCLIHKKEDLFDEAKISTFKAVLNLEIKNLLDESEKKEFKGEVTMTPEALEMISIAFEEVDKKHRQLELEEVRRESLKEGKEEGKEEGRIEIAKKLKAIHTPEEISEFTGLTVETISKL